MKKKFFNAYLFLCILLSSLAGAQEETTLIFSYDGAGNLTERKIQVFPQGRLGNFNQKEDSLAKIVLDVFPNPTNTELNISGKLPENIKHANVRLIGLNGQVLRSGTYYGEKLTLDVSSIIKGIYLLEIKYSDKERTTYKIVINN